MAVIHRNDAAPNTGENAAGNFTQVFNLATTPAVEDDYDLYNLTLSYDFDGSRLLSTSSYIDQDKDQRNLGFRFQFTPPGTPRFDFDILSQIQTSRIFTDELRLTSSGSGPWQWTLGGFYRHGRIGFDRPALLFGLAGPPGTPLPAPFSSFTKTVSESWAAFGDLGYQLSDRLTVGGGLRTLHYDQQRTDGVGAGAPTQTATFHALNPRAYARYEVNDRVNLYASVAKGFRSGGFNFPGQPSFDPEKVWTYEVGTKMALFDGRLLTDGAVFYSDYTDYQIVGVLLPPAVPQTVTSNAGSARVAGVEWSLAWEPLDRWTLSFSGNYLDTRFREINVGSSAYDVGDPLDLVPKYGFTLSTQRDLNWARRTGFVRVDYNQQGRSTFRNRNVSGPSPWYFSESDIINMLNLNLSARWSRTLSVGLFVQNLLNDRGFTDPISIEESASRARPRTVGIQFGVQLD
jgi:iron complex outermembrane recepter protein